VIRFGGLTKFFGSLRAVDGLTLAVERGEAVALLGPNGSGKTTALKAAAGLIRPSAGEVWIGEPGRSPQDPEARRAVSYLPQKVAFPESVTGREVLQFYRRLRNLDGSRVDEVLRFASLNGASDRLVGAYSGGMLQRLGLAVAVLPDTQILLLDEPTAALDPDGLCAFYGLVERRRREGHTLLFTSHQLGDVERLADRFALLVEGRLAATLTQRELVDRLSQRGVLKLRLDRRIPGLLDRVREVSPAAVWAADELIVPGAAADRPRVLDVVRDAGAEIRGLAAEEGRLDVLYRELVAGSSP
jgi:Cu-processing system ATP-binding protein